MYRSDPEHRDGRTAHAHGHHGHGQGGPNHADPRLVERTEEFYAETAQTEIQPVTYQQKCTIALDAAEFDSTELY